MEFVAYQLKYVNYPWYEDWEGMRGDDAKLVMWDEFFGVFLITSFLRS